MAAPLHLVLEGEFPGIQQNPEQILENGRTLFGRCCRQLGLHRSPLIFTRQPAEHCLKEFCDDVSIRG
jgi:hypothetical protein